MPIRPRQKKCNAEPRQKQKQHHPVIDPLVNPGSPPHRRQARAKADTTRTHHRMVTLAQSSSGGRSESPPQSETATVMLDPHMQKLVVCRVILDLIDADGILEDHPVRALEVEETERRTSDVGRERTRSARGVR